MSRRKLAPAVQLALERSEAEDTRPRAHRIELVLPFPPSVNNLYRSFVAGGRVMRAKTTEGKHYEKAVRDTLGTVLAASGRRPPAPPYRFTLRAYPPDDKRRHDLDNLQKAVIDSLFSGLPDDDCEIVHIDAHKEPPDAWPRVVVVLEGSGE